MTWQPSKRKGQQEAFLNKSIKKPEHPLRFFISPESLESLAPLETFFKPVAV